jgi:hypothetical protein
VASAWLCLMLLVTPPWTSRAFALPFLSVLLTSEEVERTLGRRHKTVPEWTKQLVKLIRRWLASPSHQACWRWSLQRG